MKRHSKIKTLDIIKNVSFYCGDNELEYKENNGKYYINLGKVKQNVNDNQIICNNTDIDKGKTK